MNEKEVLNADETSYTQEEKEKLGKVYAIVLEALDQKSKAKRNHSLKHESRLKEGFRTETPLVSLEAIPRRQPGGPPTGD